MRNLPLHILLAILFLWAVSPLAAQEDIEKRQAELESLRSEINQFEERIGEQKKSEKVTLELLDSYDRKTTLVRSLVRKLRKAETSLQGRIDSTKNEMDQLEAQLDFLKRHYADYVTAVYKTGRIRDVELLLTARSLNQAIVRSEYLTRFSEQRKKDAEKIKAKKAEIGQLQLVLQGHLTEQRRLIAEKGEEEDRLALVIADKQDVLRKIRKDKNALQKEIVRKKKSADELEKAIADLIEAERLRRERADSGVMPPVEGDFKSFLGKLRWPVPSRTVVAGFGNVRHPVLKTVTDNPGIDISVKPGTPVTAVAAGRVARIWWLVSYGNLIILDHGGGYRTIYAHLGEITVTEGQEVGAGDIIATSGETLDGSRLHFEIWKDREKQDPRQWLARQ